MEKDGGKDDRYLTIREAVEFTSMHANTIRKYGNAGILPCYKTPTGQRRFSKAVLQEFCSGVSAPPPIPRANKTSYLYSRVSSKKQLDDLSRQAAFLSAYRPEYASYVAVFGHCFRNQFQEKRITDHSGCLHAAHYPRGCGYPQRSPVQIWIRITRVHYQKRRRNPRRY